MSKKYWIICNGFLHGSVIEQQVHVLFQQAKAQGLDVTLYKNTQVQPVFDNGKILFSPALGKLPDKVLFWDKDIHLARSLEMVGSRLFNKASAIEMCDDKAYTQIILTQQGIQMPKTVILPKRYPGFDSSDLHFTKNIITTIGFPMVVKEIFGSFGQQVYLAEDETTLHEIILQTSPKTLVFQEFIQSSRGRDKRLYIIGNECVCGMKRRNEDFRSNLFQGGRAEPYNPGQREIEIAVRSCKALDLDFAGVDLLDGPDGMPMVCEVNSNAQTLGISECTGINVAELIIQYVKNAE